MRKLLFVLALLPILSFGQKFKDQRGIIRMLYGGDTLNISFNDDTVQFTSNLDYYNFDGSLTSSGLSFVLDSSAVVATSQAYTLVSTNFNGDTAAWLPLTDSLEADSIFPKDNAVIVLASDVDITDALHVKKQGGGTSDLAITIGDVNTGFYAITTSDFDVVVNGTVRGRFGGNGFSGTAGDAYRLRNIGSNIARANIHPHRSDASAGLGGAVGEPALITNDISRLKVTDLDVQIQTTLVTTSATIVDNDATPDISGGNIFTYNGTANSVVIIDLDNPVVGSIITIVGNSDTFTATINDSGNFNLSASWVGGIDDTLTLLVQADNDYIELSRSNN